MERRIFFLVLGAHLIGLLALEWGSQKDTPRPISIRQVKLSHLTLNKNLPGVAPPAVSPPKHVTKANPPPLSSVPQQKKPPQSVVEKRPPPTKTPLEGSKKAVVKTATPSSTNKASPSSPPKKPQDRQTASIDFSKEEHALLKKLNQTLDSFGKVELRGQQPLILPTLPSLSISAEVDENGNSADESSTLISFLKQELELPEEGEVKLRLSILSTGKLSDLKILSSKNKKNEEYLKNKLQTLTLPCFNGSSRELHYTIVFRHE